MPRNMPGPMLCMADQETQQHRQDHQSESRGSGVGGVDNNRADANKTNNTEQNENELYVICKDGEGIGKCKGKSKGYGECRHCGERGRPRRECPQFLAQHNSKGTMSALKVGKSGSWKGNGKNGKGGTGYGYKGKGKINTSNYYNNYISPSKVVGKGSNSMSDDWYNVWFGGILRLIL